MATETARVAGAWSGIGEATRRRGGWPGAVQGRARPRLSSHGGLFRAAVAPQQGMSRLRRPVKSTTLTSWSFGRLCPALLDSIPRHISCLSPWGIYRHHVSARALLASNRRPRRHSCPGIRTTGPAGDHRDAGAGGGGSIRALRGSLLARGSPERNEGGGAHRDRE
jgi:hypothetical protein